MVDIAIGRCIERICRQITVVIGYCQIIIPADAYVETEAGIVIVCGTARAIGIVVLGNQIARRVIQPDDRIKAGKGCRCDCIADVQVCEFIEIIIPAVARCLIRVRAIADDALQCIAGGDAGQIRQRYRAVVLCCIDGQTTDRPAGIIARVAAAIHYIVAIAAIQIVHP